MRMLFVKRFVAYYPITVSVPPLHRGTHADLHGPRYVTAYNLEARPSQDGRHWSGTVFAKTLSLSAASECTRRLLCIGTSRHNRDNCAIDWQAFHASPRMSDHLGHVWQPRLRPVLLS